MLYLPFLLDQMNAPVYKCAKGPESHGGGIFLFGYMFMYKYMANKTKKKIQVFWSICRGWFCETDSKPTLRLRFWKPTFRGAYHFLKPTFRVFLILKPILGTFHILKPTLKGAFTFQKCEMLPFGKLTSGCVCVCVSINVCQKKQVLSWDSCEYSNNSTP